MTVLLVVLLGAALWCLAPLPVAVAVGRSFRASDIDETFEEIVRDYDASSV